MPQLHASVRARHPPSLNSWRDLVVKKLLLAALLLAGIVLAPRSFADPGALSALGDKLQPYIQCLNDFSGRAHSSRSRYLSWAAEAGPTGKESVIYGTYTISDPHACAAKLEAANAAEPHEADLEAAGAAYAKALITLAPLLKAADDYYTQENYKDDKMAKGKEMHPKLMAAWSDFSTADAKLHDAVSRLNDQIQLQELADIEKSEGRAAHYYTLNVMITAKQLLHVESGDSDDTPDLAKIDERLKIYEAAANDLDHYVEANPDLSKDIHNLFISDIVSSAKSYLTTAKQLMRRIRDKTPYSTGEKMNLTNGGGWMVEGSPPRLFKDYNDLVNVFNRMH
jgi:Protein of unknown function (DUF3829)